MDEVERLGSLPGRDSALVSRSIWTGKLQFFTILHPIGPIYPDGVDPLIEYAPEAKGECFAGLSDFHLEIYFNRKIKKVLTWGDTLKFW